MQQAKTKTNTASAQEVLTELARGKTTDSEESGGGKRRLPEAEKNPVTLEPDFKLVEPEPQLEQEPETAESGDEIAFTEKDRKDFPRLERQCEKGQRQAAEALREIRTRQLWRLIEDEDGKQKYATFDQYVEDRWGRTRQWCTQLTNWLVVTEEMERLGVTDPPHLSVRAVQGLSGGHLCDAGGLQAVLAEAKADGVPFDREHLRAIVERRYAYFSEEVPEFRKPAAPTYDQYRADLAALEQFATVPTSPALVEQAANRDGDFADNLVSVCQEQQSFPSTERLLAKITGEELEAVVERLKPIADELQQTAEEKRQYEETQQKIKEIERQGLQQLKEEQKKLKEKLTAKGIFKSTKRPQQPDQQNQGQTDKQERETSQDNSPPASEVRQSLDSALESLDDALTGDWPVDDTEELDRIVAVAEDIEKKLAEITAKAKELLADVEESEAVSSVD